MVTVRLTPSREIRFSHDAEAFAANRHYSSRNNSDPDRRSRTPCQPRHHRLGSSLLNFTSSRDPNRYCRSSHWWSLSLLQPDLAGNRGRLSPWKRLGVDPGNDLYSPLHTRRGLRRVYRSVPSGLRVGILDYHDHLSYQISRQSFLQQRDSLNLHACDEHSADNAIRTSSPITDTVRSNGSAHPPVQPSPSANPCTGAGDSDREVSLLRHAPGFRQFLLH